MKSEKNNTKKGIHVLIIEDDELLMNVLKQRFKAQGYTIKNAESANEARGILQNSHIDIILLDIILPETNGFIYLKELKADEKLKNIPVIIISNLGQREEVEKGLKLGAVDYIIKAHTFPEEIIDKVQNILNKK